MDDKFRRAYPSTPDSFDRRMRQTLAALPRRGGRWCARSIAAVALAATLALGGLAFAFSQSTLLPHLFSGTKPSREAERLLVQLGSQTEKDGLTLTIDEYLLDGADLYVDWTITSSRDEPLLLVSSGLTADADAQNLGDDDASMWYWGGGVLLDAEHPTYSAVSRLHFDEACPKTDFDVSLTAAVFRPTAPIVDSQDAGEFSDRPTLLRSRDGDAQLVFLASERTASGSDAWVLGGGALDEATDFEGFSEALEREGYGEELAAVPVRFTVQPQPERMVRTEIAGQRAFVFDRFILVVERANFTAAGANLRLRVTPRNVKGLADFSSDLWFEILPDGREADNGFMQTRYLSEGSIVVEVLARAGSELPKFVRILPTTDDGRPLPQYAADVRLRVVEY